MDCLEYTDANELFSDLVNDISGACALAQSVQVEVCIFENRVL